MFILESIQLVMSLLEKLHQACWIQRQDAQNRFEPVHCCMLWLIVVCQTFLIFRFDNSGGEEQNN